MTRRARHAPVVRRVRRPCIISETSQCAFVCIGPILVSSNLSLWVKTELCVALVACPMCQAKRGELCRRASGKVTSGVRWPRRKAAKESL